LPNIPTIYLDSCCLNRPFDDQTVDRIKIESEAIILILKNARNGKIKLIGSDVLLLEISKTLDPVRKFKLSSLTKSINKFVVSDTTIRNRAKMLSEIGFNGFDAYHIACAEKEMVDLFLTTDDKIIKLFSRNQKTIRISIKNPIQWMQEYYLK